MAGIKSKVIGEMKRGGGVRRARRKILPRIAATAALGVLFLAAGFARADAYVYWYQWGTFGTGNGQFGWPWSATVAPNGRIYVTESRSNRIQYFTPDGSYLGQWGTSGTGDGQFMEPLGIAATPDSNIYVLDHGNSRVQYFTPDGSFIGKWGSKVTADGRFESPYGIAVSPDYSVYVADTSNYRIQKFTGAGSFVLKWGSYGTGNGNFLAPNGITIAPNGDVYVTDIVRDVTTRERMNDTFPASKKERRTFADDLRVSIFWIAVVGNRSYANRFLRIQYPQRKTRNHACFIGVKPFRTLPAIKDNSRSV